MTKTAKTMVSALTLGAIALLGAVGDAAANDAPCVGRAAPEQAYSAFIDAAKVEDWRTAYSHVEPDSRARLNKETISGLVVLMGMMAEDDKWREFTAILQDHGFEVNAEHQLLLADADWSDIRDHPRLMRRLSEFMARNFDRRLVPDRHELTDLRTANDTAVAQLKLRKGKTKAVHFKKTDSGWCLAAR